MDSRDDICATEYMGPWSPAGPRLPAASCCQTTERPQRALPLDRETFPIMRAIPSAHVRSVQQGRGIVDVAQTLLSTTNVAEIEADQRSAQIQRSALFLRQRLTAGLTDTQADHSATASADGPSEVRLCVERDPPLTVLGSIAWIIVR